MEMRPLQDGGVSVEPLNGCPLHEGEAPVLPLPAGEREMLDGVNDLLGTDA
jgi:hypothetical protein